MKELLITLGLAAGVSVLMQKITSKTDKLPLSSTAKGLSLQAKMKSINDIFGAVLLSEANKIGIPVSTAAAILAVESSGKGIGSDGKLLIRFEPGIFKKYTNIAVVASHKNNAAEHQTFTEACKLDKEAAYKSISMGIGQVMGFNAKRVGYANAEEMFNTFGQSLEAQIAAVFKFIATDSKLLDAAKTDDFATFAYKYNGSGYAANKYDVKLADAKKSFVSATGIV
jgi:hypothetical protein